MKFALIFLVGAFVSSQCLVEYAVRKTQVVIENRLAASETVFRHITAIAEAIVESPTEIKTARHFVGTYSPLVRGSQIGDFPKAFYSRFNSSNLQVRRYSEPHGGNDHEWDWILEIKETGPDSYSIVATYSLPYKGLLCYV